MSSDFAGLAGLSIATIGTVALADITAKSIRKAAPRRSRKSRGKKK